MIRRKPSTGPIPRLGHIDLSMEDEGVGGGRQFLSSPVAMTALSRDCRYYTISRCYARAHGGRGGGGGGGAYVQCNELRPASR